MLLVCIRIALYGYSNVYKQDMLIIERHNHVVGTHSNCLIWLFQFVQTTYAMERNKEDNFEIYTYQISC